MFECTLAKIGETWHGVSREGAGLAPASGPSSPHIRDSADIKRYMASVMFALLPALISGVYVFGPRMLLLLLTSHLSGGIVEVAFAVLRRKPIEEGFLVTGIIFALTLPPGLPLWMVSVGIIFGTFSGRSSSGAPAGMSSIRLWSAGCS